MKPSTLKVKHLAGAIALITAAHQPAFAERAKGAVIEEITITASRLKESGYEAPTPVTMLGTDDMEARGVTNIADLVNEVPSFSATLSTQSTTLNSRQNGVSGLDLRGLGANRNLVLVNGRRHVPFDENGIVNVAAIPTVIIKRVDIVTGGASAAWGTDAVSGVVNIVFDDELEGAKIDVQGGQSAEGDAKNGRISAAFGQKFADDRGHFMVAADVFDNDGVPASSARDWSNEHWAILSNPNDTSPNDGIPSRIIRPNAALYLASPNGVTLGNGSSPIDNLEFLPDGTAIPRELGAYASGSHMLGGSGSYLSDNTALDVPVERNALLGSVRFDLTDTLRIFAEGSYTVSESDGALINAFRFGDPIIKSGNPYLPDSVQALMDENGIEAFPLFRTFEEIPPIASVSENKNKRFVLGAEGDYGDSGWWEAYYQYGNATFSNKQPYNMLVQNLRNAADAVIDPATGEIVCRANLGGANGAPGCAPANLFGKGSLSPEAIDYITDTGGSWTKLDQDVFSISMGGDVFEGWAGPIVAAIGADYREESLRRKVTDNDDNSAFIIVNAKPLAGEMDVKEIFTEWGVPLISGEQSLDFNAAVRWADYSSVGSATSWKTGMVYQPTESLVVRGTVSQDIRAPSIGEQFLEATLLFANITNPFTGDSNAISRLLTGNENLDQEESKTKTIGVVWSPMAADLQFSLDWYDISITDAIDRTTDQQILDRCFGGENEMCQLISFGANQEVTEIVNPLLNLGSVDVEGLDFSSDYSMDLGGGTLGINLLASYLINKEFDASGNNPVDVVGEMGLVSNFGAPETKARLGLSYDRGPWGIYGQMRYVSSGYYNPNWGAEDISASDNSIPSVTYFDVSGYYRFDLNGMDRFELYGGVTNLGDKDPPVAPRDFISNIATNPVHYDVIGQRFYLGLRMTF
ncbi:TonB-dependent receptor domain-containing protein [Parahaliea mediterranea]|uniref:TonB-dependent receptor n=1 Tax=Parahaliea mediterranea TaxID=651086 RepID=A0A939DG76_9GAMM|nr:TonB-dependent receptor [Parahaliea mediterranea]MBN7797629.1 TonB-dependent receptor [Parahaliea mediterranea]